MNTTTSENKALEGYPIKKKPTMLKAPVTLVSIHNGGTLTFTNLGQLCSDLDWSEKQVKRIIADGALQYAGWRLQK